MFADHVVDGRVLKFSTTRFLHRTTTSTANLAVVENGAASRRYGLLTVIW